MPPSRASSAPAPAALRLAAAHVGESCLCFNLRKAARAVTQAYDDALRDTGLRSTQFTLLTLLLGYGAMAMHELAEVSGTDRTTLTRNLALLARSGYVRSVADPAAGRTRRTELTDSGRDAVRAALPKWEAAQGELTDKLGPAAALLRRNLSAVIDATSSTPSSS